MNPRLAIKPAPPHQPRTLANVQDKLDRALSLAWAARRAAEQGDQDRAAALRAEGDAIYVELDNLLHKG